MIEQFVEAWNRSNRANLMLLTEISEKVLAAAPRSRARNIAEQFAHLHNVRVMWLENAQPDPMSGIEKIDKASGADPEHLKDALKLSGKAMAEMIRLGFEAGEIKGFSGHPPDFFAYMIAHEAHHRGQILLTLKQSGETVEQSIQYGLWDWGKL